MGDCDGDRSVTVDEVVKLINIVLGLAGLDECSGGIEEGQLEIAIDDIVRAVNHLLSSCPAASG